MVSSDLADPGDLRAKLVFELGFKGRFEFSWRV